VTLTLEDGTRYPSAGKLQFPTSPSTRARFGDVRAVVSESDHVLLPGMFVRASIEQGVNDNALLARRSGSPTTRRDRPLALVVGADNKVEVRAIRRHARQERTGSSRTV